MAVCNLCALKTVYLTQMGHFLRFGHFPDGRQPTEDALRRRRELLLG